MDTILIAVVLAIIVALIVISVMKGQMKPVAQKHEAAQYTEASDVKITTTEDVFLRTDVTRTPIESKQTSAKTGT